MPKERNATNTIMIEKNDLAKSRYFNSKQVTPDESVVDPRRESF